MQNDLLTTLRNAIYQLLPNTTDAADALIEGRLFQETVGSFFDIVAVWCCYTMDPSEKKLHILIINYVWC